MADLLKNYKIMMTGSTGGLGSVLAEELNKNGAFLFADYRDRRKFEELRERLNHPDRVDGFQGDMMKEKDVIQFFKNFSAKYKRLDVFLHIMGGFWMGPEIAETPLDKWNRMMDLNLSSTFMCTREAFKIMKSQCSGRIFTVGAQAAEEYPPRKGAYAVSKAGVLALTRVLANEGKAYDIQVNAVLPGTIDTPANREAMPDADYSAWVSPKDIARLIIYLSRPDATALSQSFLKVYGKQ